MSEQDIVRIRVHIGTNKVGSECTDELDFEREVWEAMSEEERDEICRDAAFNCMEWGWVEL